MPAPYQRHLAAGHGVIVLLVTKLELRRELSIHTLLATEEVIQTLTRHGTRLLSALEADVLGCLLRHAIGARRSSWLASTPKVLDHPILLVPRFPFKAHAFVELNQSRTSAFIAYVHFTTVIG